MIYLVALAMALMFLLCCLLLRQQNQDRIERAEMMTRYANMVMMTRQDAYWVAPGSVPPDPFGRPAPSSVGEVEGAP